MYTHEPPTLDGLLNEPTWGMATPIGLRYIQRGDETQPTGFVRLLHDDEALYAAYTLADDDIASTFTTRDEFLWKQDVVELFIKPLADSPVYYEFQVSPAGQLLDARWPSFNDRQDLTHLTWDADITAAVTVDGTFNRRTDRDAGWTVELRIPWHVLDAPPAAGARILLSHYDYSVNREKRRVVASAPVRRMHDHPDWNPLILGRSNLE